MCVARGESQQSGTTQASRRAGRTSSWRVAPDEVVTAVETLYADRIYPSARILLKRLGELVAASAAASRDGSRVLNLPAGEVPRIDLPRLRRICEQSPRLRVSTCSGEYHVLLADRDPDFVDTSSNIDPFSEALWSSVRAYFEGPGAGLSFPGGRYSCARALLASDLDFLAGFSLGEVCHMVQLAISQRKVLGYFLGQIVAYARSETVMKQHCAALKQPTWALKKDAMNVASLPQARRCLQALLHQPQGDGPVGLPLPNVKRLFRRWNLELSETALGFSRLHELLGSECFNDICTLEARENTYYVLPCCPSSSAALSPDVTPVSFNASHSTARGPDCTRSSSRPSPNSWASAPATAAAMSPPPGLFKNVAPAVAPRAKRAGQASGQPPALPLSSGMASAKKLLLPSPAVAPPPPPAVNKPTMPNAKSPLVSSSGVWSSNGCSSAGVSGWGSSRSSDSTARQVSQESSVFCTAPPPGLEAAAPSPGFKYHASLYSSPFGAIDGLSPGSDSTTCSSFCTPRSPRSPRLIETSTTNFLNSMPGTAKGNPAGCDKTMPVKLVRPFTAVPCGRLEVLPTSFSLFGALNTEPSRVQPPLSSAVSPSASDDVPSLYVCTDPWRQSGDDRSFAPSSNMNAISSS